MATTGIEFGPLVIAKDSVASAGQTAGKEEVTKPILELQVKREEVSEARGRVEDGSVQEATEAFNKALGLLNRGLRFEVDEETDTVIAQVVDRETQEVIRQVPPEEFVKLAQRLAEFVGLLFDQEA